VGVLRQPGARRDPSRPRLVPKHPELRKNVSLELDLLHRHPPMLYHYHLYRGSTNLKRSISSICSILINENTKSNYVWILCAQPCPNLKIQNWIWIPPMVISFVRSSPLDVAVERSQPVGSFLLFFKFRFNVKTIVQITAVSQRPILIYCPCYIRAKWTVHLSSPCPHNSGCVNNWLQPYPLIPFSHICPFKKTI
jgi:hypothetical protein